MFVYINICNNVLLKFHLKVYLYLKNDKSGIAEKSVWMKVSLYNRYGERGATSTGLLGAACQELGMLC